MMKKAEDVGSFSEDRVREFYNWMYQRQDGKVQACAFPVPTETGDSVRGNSQYKHTDSVDEFVEFCRTHSGLWRYQVYAGVNVNSSVPEYGRGKVKHISKVKILPFDIETQRDSYEGSTREDVFWSYCYGMAIVQHMEDEYGALPLTVMSENGIHLHYRVNFPIDDDLLHEKQHIYSKYLTRDAWNSDYVTEVEKRAPEDLEFSPDDVSDPPRVMKVPGTLGIKSPNGRLCGIIHAPSSSQASVITENQISESDISSFEQTLDKSDKPTYTAGNPDKSDLDRDKSEKIENLCQEDQVFEALWNGRTLHYDSRSEAEMALLLKLLSYSFYPDELSDLMYMSGMTKWEDEGKHYRKKTVENALSSFDGEATKDRTDSEFEFKSV